MVTDICNKIAKFLNDSKWKGSIISLSYDKDGLPVFIAVKSKKEKPIPCSKEYIFENLPLSNALDKFMKDFPQNPVNARVFKLISECGLD